MKEKLYFLKWCGHKIVASIKSWDRWMWAWMLTCLFCSMWANSEKGSDLEYITKIIVTALVIGFWFCYAIVFTGVKNAWKSYQEEKQKVINILGERNEFSTNGR